MNQTLLKPEPISEKNTQFCDALPSSFISHILSPYFEHCRYLQQATVSGTASTVQENQQLDLKISAEFNIDSSCYIQSTGHFNAVEYVICQNQLGYLLYAKIAEMALLENLHPKTDLNWFKQKQLPSVVILDMQPQFKQMINANKFYGELTWKAVIVKKHILINQHDLTYWDDGDGSAFGSVTAGIIL